MRTQTWSDGPDVPDSNSSPYIYQGRLVNAQSGSKYAAYLIGGKNGYSYQTKVYGISKNLQTWEDVGITLRPRHWYVALSVPSTLANHTNCTGQGNDKEPFYLETTIIKWHGKFEQLDLNLLILLCQIILFRLNEGRSRVNQNTIMMNI